MTEAVLETTGLTKAFNSFKAVSDVDLRIEAGSIHALIGPNGAGKTTCFNLLTKFLQPSAGTIRFNIALQRVRGSNFDFWRSDAVLRRYNDRAHELLFDVGLSDAVDTAAAELSYGRKRALEIATTLALDPQMMLLDEPTAGMTETDVARIVALIKTLRAGRTILMVEHNLSVVSGLSDRITVLTRGRILAEGDYETVSNHPDVISAYLGTDHA
ncbi:MAG: ABC transporter ATP-binding protein [Rhodospirillales bacterium 20-64-7]|nr:MAG: ABC transporter ATP-binding protein [Rhodospirillales bacterium 20-64-7]